MRMGIYGGTFSPPHNGHIHAALAFLRQLSLDRLLIVPTNIPPHKADPSASAVHRLEMSKLAFENLPQSGGRIQVDDYEIQSSDTSYTSRTLEHFSGEDRELFFLCGTDMFLTLAAWHRPDEICRLATVVLMRREQNRYLDDAVRRAWDDLEERFHARIVQINLPPILLSSSDVRERIAAGKDVSDALPDGVIRYIRENRLYGWNE